ncbi:hypothetical protein DPMN_080327 [Dreissena polymorpha]|uniref:Uncharacterized protein n=1 Tax=Dreissena polymorpha TaxID=45954 RepID=A0A9D4BQV2_DREPO|nr:hypothetical protein DPMN_080327 [Dreissena polymorpha]
MAESMLLTKGKSPAGGSGDKENINVPIQVEKPATVSKQPMKKPDKPQKTDKDPTKEVLLILRELNSNVVQQGEKLEKLNGRVDTLYEWYDHTPDVQFQGDYHEIDEHEQQPVDINCSNTIIDGVQSECEPGKNSRQCFKGLSDKFLFSEKVDNEVNDDLAMFINTSFRSGVSEERVTEICKDVHRPVNCEALTKTRVNPGIWRLLKPQTQTEDAKMQSIQNNVVKASINIAKLLDKEGQNVDAQSLEWGTNALALLGQSN